MVRTIIVAAFCLLGGGAIGYFFAFQQMDEVRQVSANLPGEARANESASNAEQSVAPHFTPRAMYAEEHAVAAAQKPAAKGVIKGRVVDKLGRGVAGTLFKARRANASDPRGFNRPGVAPESVLGPEEMIALLRERISRDPALEVTAFSDSEGNFALSGLENHPYNIESYLTNHTLVGLEGLSPFSGRWPGDVLQLRALPLCSVDVEIRLPDGSAPATAELSVRRNDSNETWQWTPQDRLIPLSPGLWTLQARGGDMCMFRSKEELVEVTEGGTPATAILQLAERPLIRGRLLFDGAPPAKNYTVIAWAEKHNPATSQTWEAPNISDQARTLATTGFQFEDLEPGIYRLSVSDGQNEHPPVLATVTLADKMVMQDLPVVVNLGAEWVVRVLDPSGAPVDDANLESSFWMGQNNGWARDLEGAWHASVFHNVVDDDNKTVLLLTVQSSQWGRLGVTLPRGAGTVEVRMQPTGFLKAQLSSGQSGGKQKLSASLQLVGPERETLAWFDDSSAGEDGAVSFSPLQPGSYVLRLNMRSDSWGGSQSVAEQALQIHSGENQTSLGAPALHTVKVRIDAGDQHLTGHIQLQQHPDVMDTLNYQTYESMINGVAQFANVPAGRYLLNFWVRGRNGSTAINVPTAEVQIKLENFRALRLKLHDKESPLSALGFKEGDLLVGCDGREFANSSELDTAMRFVGSKEDVPMLILRNGQVQTLNLSGKLFVESKGFSWSLATR
ncbi:MAG: hypothetical protein EXS14_01735 [Planctomycetes bacterium]|nr:hypothetical protein [Planctomycetota bacterium]